MKKYIENIWMRIIISFICTAAVLGIVVSMIPALFFWQAGDEKTVYKNGQENIAKNYALYIYDELMAGKKDKLANFLANTNIEAAVVKTDNSLGSEVSEEEKTVMIYSFSQPEIDQSEIDIEEIGQESVILTNPEMGTDDIEGINLANAYMLEIYEGTAYHYNIDSLFGAMQSDIYFLEDNYMVPTKVTGFSYDVNTGIFYYETAQGCYEVTYLYVFDNMQGGSCDYRLVKDGVRTYYYNDYFGRELDVADYKKWDFVEIEGIRLYFDNRGGENRWISVIEDSSVIEETLRDDYYYVSDMMLYYSNVEEVDKYQIYISVNEPEGMENDFAKKDLFQEWKMFVNDMSEMREHTLVSFLISAVFLIGGLIVLGYAAPSEKEKIGFFHKLPVFSYSAGIIAADIVAFALCLELVADVYYGRFYNPMDLSIILAGSLAMTALFVGFLWLGNIIGRIKTKTFWRYSEFYYIYQPISKVWELAGNHIPLIWKGLGVMAVLSFIEVFMIAVSRYDADMIFFWFFLGKCMEIPIVLFVLLQMKELQEGSKRIAEGDLSHPLQLSHLKWEFKKHGQNLNNVSESISRAVDKQLKSERFKTELITNVSHDIKTPLTSIINYVDLLKKENITDETILEYVDVLDRQSARLKKLIEDLMEASKASTGNLSVQLEECDVEVLFTQLIGEFEDKLAANELELIVDKPEMPVLVKADGRHMWRVLDNLMNNVCKYALPHTRVYLSLKKEEQMAVITFRNISKAALNIPSDELLERFVRGDSSRNTEGSGLGLSIAQSLTELMNGSMKLDIDGDLFKITLKFHALL